MKKDKLGFTLTEVLLVLVILGVIVALSVHAFKVVQSSYTAVAYFAENNVNMLVRTLFIGNWANDNTIQCKKANGEFVTILKPDGVSQVTDMPLCSSLYKSGGTSKICNTMVSLSNVSGTTNCGNLYSVEYDSAYYNEPYISNINQNKSPTFITTNGHRYYLSGSTFSSYVSSDIGFRVLAVDLNGSRRPNSFKSSKTATPPDIVMFLIMDNGEVYPLGVAADNMVVTDKSSKKDIKIRYILSAVKGFCRKGQNKSDCASVLSTNKEPTEYVTPECTVKGNPNVSKCGYFVDKSSTIMSYRQAYCASMGAYVYDDDYKKKKVYSQYCKPVEDTCVSSNGTYEYCSYMLRCPPSGHPYQYDSCKVENTKPIFRFNFN